MSDAAGRAPSMQLVAQDFGEILAALKAAQDAKGHERRALARMDVQAQVKVYPHKDGRLAPAYTCLTRDLSFRGIGLFQARPSPRGSQFVVLLPRKQGAESLSLLCTVMYCRPLADGLYNVGASFNRPFDVDAAPKVEFTAGNDAAGGAKGGNGATQSDEEMNRIRQSILG
jgi:hypothetical protein